MAMVFGCVSAARSASFPHETRGGVGHLEIRMEDLQRDLAPKLLVERTVDLTHAAFADRRFDHIAGKGLSGREQGGRTLALMAMRRILATMAAFAIGGSTVGCGSIRPPGSHFPRAVKPVAEDWATVLHRPGTSRSRPGRRDVSA